MDGQPLDDSSDDAFWSAEEHNSQGFDSDSDDQCNPVRNIVANLVAETLFVTC